MKQALTIGLVVFAMSAATRAQVTNSYHFGRTFVPVTYTSGTPTAYKVILGAKALTGIVGPTNIFVRSNETFATEYEGFAWGYESANAAWTSAFAIYPNYSTNYATMTYDNAGWIKGTRQAYGDWGAFIWLLQNTIAFTSSASSVYVSSNGATSAIASVLVGTLGDYCPQTFVTETGPVFNTNYPGSNMGTDEVFRADLNAYYKLVPSTYLGVNNDDSDGDGIPDFADGYNLSATNSADDLSTNDFFTAWPIQLSSNASPTQALISITYAASDPAGVTASTNGYVVPTNGYFRLWTKQGFKARNKASVTNGGDYIPSGTYPATALGFNATNRIVELYIEPINPTTNREIVIQVDPDGAGPKGFVCVDKLFFGVVSITLEPITLRPGNGSTLPLFNASVIELGSNTTYEISVEPSNIPSDHIVWRVPTGSVGFVGTNYGRTVTVQGNAAGTATLAVDIRDFAGPTPMIQMQILAVQTSKVFVYVIADSNGVPATTQSRIDDLLRGVNDIYKQVGIRFLQEGQSATVTNSAWVDISASNNFQEFFDMCSTAQKSGGIELYFVRDIDSGIRGLNYSSSGPDAGCAVSTNGDFRTVAHELGHACGLADIYDVDSSGVSLPDALVRQAWASKDWNGGSSPLYYPSTLDHKVLINRLLMYGFGGNGISKADIPSGRIYGYKNVGSIRITSDVAVGLQDMNRSPTHW